MPRKNPPAPTSRDPSTGDRPKSGASTLTRTILRGYAAAHAVLALVFVLAALVLIVVAFRLGWAVLQGGFTETVAIEVIQIIGIAAVAVVALQIAQTITEEEVIREAQVSGPTRVRRFLSRFLVVIVVALGVEGLIATFKALREDLTQLPYAASLLVALGVLLAGWGAFIWCNR